MEECIKKNVVHMFIFANICIHTTGYYSAIKMNGILSFLTKCMRLQSISLTKISRHRRKNMFSVTCGVNIKQECEKYIFVMLNYRCFFSLNYVSNIFTCTSFLIVWVNHKSQVFNKRKTSTSIVTHWVKQSATMLAFYMSKYLSFSCSTSYAAPW